MNIYFIKVRNFFHYIIFVIIDLILHFRKIKVKNKTLLIIRLDAIGDYILIRNYFRLFREDEKYQHSKITLCGNSIWKDIAEEMDKDVFNEFIWMDRKKFRSNIIYKYRFLKNINKRGFETVIDTTYSRELLFGDSIVRASRAINRIGCTGSLDSYASWKRKLLTDSYYTILFPSSKENLFEFERNREFFSYLFNKKVDLIKPELNPEKINPYINYGNYVVIFPGAQNDYRKWSSVNYREVSSFLLMESDFKIIVAGAESDYEAAQEILADLSSERTINMAGKTNLLQFIKLIADSKFVISNDSVAVHIAAATNVPFICISNGNHFGRFHPYPANIFDKGNYIYPEEIMNNLDRPEMLSREYRFSSDLDINSISAEQIKKMIKKILDMNK